MEKKIETLQQENFNIETMIRNNAKIKLLLSQTIDAKEIDFVKSDWEEKEGTIRLKEDVKKQLKTWNVNDSTIDTVEKALQTLKKIDKACTDALKGDLTSSEKKVVKGIQEKLCPNSPNECLNAVKRVEEISSALRKAEHVVGKGFNTNSFIRFLGACKAATKAFFTPKQSAVKAFKEVYHKDVVNTLKQRMASKEEEEESHDRPKLGH